MIFYSYLWLRDDGTPYYVGKGYGNRAYAYHWHRHLNPPKDKSKILVFPMANEAEAFESEVALIELFGRKDNGTGCLRNFTAGGEGMAGYAYVRTAETLRKQSEAAKRRAATAEGRASSSRAGKIPKPPRTDEHRRHLSEANTGHKPSIEQRQHQSEAQKGVPKPPRSEEYRRHIREGQKIRWAKSRSNACV